jgi:hypothetical protein
LFQQIVCVGETLLAVLDGLWETGEGERVRGDGGGKDMEKVEKDKV